MINLSLYIHDTSLCTACQVAILYLLFIIIIIYLFIIYIYTYRAGNIGGIIGGYMYRGHTYRAYISTPLYRGVLYRGASVEGLAMGVFCDKKGLITLIAGAGNRTKKVLMVLLPEPDESDIFGLICRIKELRQKRSNSSE